MDTNIVRTVAGKDYNRYNQEVITCIICNTNKTTMTGTKKCDRCWELYLRISIDLPLAKAIIKELEEHSYD